MDNSLNDKIPKKLPTPEEFWRQIEEDSKLSLPELHAKHLKNFQDHQKEIKARKNAVIKKGLEDKFLNRKIDALKPEEITLNEDFSLEEKIYLLENFYKYNFQEANELIKTGLKEKQKRKLKEAKKAIREKARELYGGIPSDDKRHPIPDDVKEAVWQRDQGKCVQCSSNENLEFDHIIPFSKGGSSTARNIQLLCERCNRTKQDNI